MLRIWFLVEGLDGRKGFDLVFVEFLWKGVFSLRVVHFLLFKILLVHFLMFEIFFGSDCDFECISSGLIFKLFDPERDVEERLFSQYVRKSYSVRE